MGFPSWDPVYIPWLRNKTLQSHCSSGIKENLLLICWKRLMAAESPKRIRDYLRDHWDNMIMPPVFLRLSYSLIYWRHWFFFCMQACRCWKYTHSDTILFFIKKLIFRNKYIKYSLIMQTYHSNYYIRFYNY